uniref:Putative secreted protein n=1 Tax=Panstrongylus lignarius TaxID=156445 RepID=A0A224Y6A5_9HEMI
MLVQLISFLLLLCWKMWILFHALLVHNEQHVVRVANYSSTYCSEDMVLLQELLNCLISRLFLLILLNNSEIL